MPNFGAFLTRINEKLEEAKISDLNHELGKLVQGSHTYLDNFKSDAVSLGSIIKTESNRLGGKLWGSTRSNRSSSSLPKSLSLPSFTAVQHPPNNKSLQSREADQRKKYSYKSNRKNQKPFFDDVDEGLLRGVGDVNIYPGSSSFPAKKSDVVEKFIKVIESRECSAAKSTLVPSLQNTNREDIRRKLAGFGEGSATNPSKKKPGDLEVCYINETILEEDEEEESQHDHEVGLRCAPTIPRSKTDWEGFKSVDDCSVEEQDFSSASPASSTPSPPQHAVARCDFQEEARIALANCPRIARRKFLLLKQTQLEKEENCLERLLGKRLSRNSDGHFEVESLLCLNAPTLQVIVNDLHCKIERLNEELVNLVIEKDELQIEQDSQLIDIDDLQVPCRRF